MEDREKEELHNKFVKELGYFYINMIEKYKELGMELSIVAVLSAQHLFLESYIEISEDIVSRDKKEKYVLLLLELFKSKLSKKGDK